MKSAKKNRIEFIDLYRGVGIILMVLLNVGCGTVFRVWTGGFVIPLFFFISGFLLDESSEKSLKTLVERKFRTLLIPYLIFGLAVALLAVLKRLVLFQDKPFELFWNLIFNDCLRGSVEATMWFLPALFIVNVLFFLLRNSLKNDFVFGGAVLLLLILGVLLPKRVSFPVPFSIFQSFVGLGFYTVGYFLHREEERKLVHFVLNLPAWWNVFLTLIVAGLIFINGETDMRVSEYAFFPCFFITGLFGSLALFNFCRLILPKIDYSGITKYVVNIGQNSIVYLVLVRTFIKLFWPIIRQMYLPRIPGKIFLAALVFIALLVTEKIVHKAKWNQAFGLPYQGF